ncbi:hypothetical protein KTR66_03520 [Roseococcus sp. SDR]|uniref:hypothetical protein n=1 Tax=Roseococcus sp. SDR TaxID=2835532 RepID=UPI001BCC71A8|nr:hypothetical protein [Roseococcus sp. SDR]MBS7789048.1 hypothetical protein [Roseococcus sp. SDR]MBV1844362.1 hypothetical protein [Roseococcus sp. SDR]
MILFSTPTSANGSLFRSAAHIAAGRYRPVPWVNEIFDAGRPEDLRVLVPPAEDCLIKHNAPERFNPATRLSDYRFVLNARDPRDLLCNQYHWQFVHPFPGETPEAAEARKESVRAAGIDHFVLNLDISPYLDGFLGVARRIAPPDRIFIGYAMYCLHFDVAMERLAAFLGTSLAALPPAQRRGLNKERVENLPANSNWIGRIWSGTDTAPGRHRHELQPGTISILSQRYARFLDFLRRMDDPRVAETYD